MRRASLDEGGPEIPIWKWSDWERLMESWYEEKVGRGDWEIDDAGVITSYLHDRGSLFWIRRDDRKAVMVDQVRGTSLIYALLEPGKEIFKAVREHRGWFTLSELEKVREWHSLRDNEEAREQVLDFIKECGLLIEMSGRDERYFIANHRWLLPSRELLQRSYEPLRAMVYERDGNEDHETFSFEVPRISEFEFSRLRLHLAQQWRRDVFLGADQVAFFDPEHPAKWVFWVSYKPEPGGSYYGRVDAHLNAPRDEIERLRNEIELLFYLPGSPFAEGPSKLLLQRCDKVGGVNHLEEMGYLRDAEIGISSSGADKEIALRIKAGIEARGLPHVWYLDNRVRQGEDRKVDHYMKERLGRTKVRLLLLSDHYLRHDVENNWYCPWELADRTLQCSRDTKELQRTLVVYLKTGGGEVDSKTVIDQTVKVFEALANSFSEAYSSLTPIQKRNAKYLDEQMNHFAEALEGGRVGAFFNERGTRGWYSRADEKEGELDLESLIKDVAEALKVK